MLVGKVCLAAVQQYFFPMYSVRSAEKAWLALYLAHDAQVDSA